MSSLTDHFLKVTAEKKSRQQAIPTANQNDTTLVSASQIELKFFNDFEQISNTQSQSKRNEIKTERLPEYLSYIEGVIASGVGVQNDMLLKLMVWALDTQNLIIASNIAEFALLNNMAMPEPFSRDVATVFAEEFAEAIIKRHAKIDENLAKRALDITHDHDMPDPVRAKLYRAYGNICKDHQPKNAITAYETAIRLDDKVGCKTDLEQLKKQLQ